MIERDASLVSHESLPTPSNESPRQQAFLLGMGKRFSTGMKTLLAGATLAGPAIAQPPPPLEVLNGRPVQVQSIETVQEKPPYISLVTGVMIQKLEAAKRIKALCKQEKREPTDQEEVILTEEKDMQQGMLAIRLLRCDEEMRECRECIKQGDASAKERLDDARKEYEIIRREISRATGMPKMAILPKIVRTMLDVKTKENAEKTNADLHPHSHINHVVVERSLGELVDVEVWKIAENKRLKAIEKIAADTPALEVKTATDEALIAPLPITPILQGETPK